MIHSANEAGLVHPDGQRPPGRSVRSEGRRDRPHRHRVGALEPCRFGGHCRVFYSVAQHASLVSDVLFERTATPADALWALLHDAAEAYLVDLPHPLKHRSELGRLYREAEARLQRCILDRFGLTAEPPPLLKEVDRALLATERRLFSSVAWHWPELDGVEPLALEIRPWRPERARREFLDRSRRVRPDL